MDKKYLYAGLGIIFFAVSFFIDEYVLSFFQAIKNTPFDYVMSWISNIGSVFVVMIFMTTLFLWEDRKREYIVPMWLSFLSSLIVTHLLKIIVARPRPVLEVVPLLSLFSYSFPSAHVAVVFSIVPILDRELPKFKWFWIGFAVLVAISRMYLQAHYLSDVIAGALIGYFIGHFFLIFEKKRRPFKKIFQEK